MSKYAVRNHQRAHLRATHIGKDGITHPQVHYYVNQDGPTTEEDADYQLTFFDTEKPPEGYRYGFEKTGLAATVCEYTGDSDIEKIAMPYPYRYSMINMATESPVLLSAPLYTGWFTAVADALTGLGMTGVDSFQPFNDQYSRRQMGLVAPPNLKATPEVHEDFMYYLTRNLSPYPEYVETTLRIPPSHKKWEEGTLEYLLNYAIHANLFTHHKCGEDAMMERFEKILETVLPFFEVNHFVYAAPMGSAMETLTLHGTPRLVDQYRPPLTITINLSLLALTELIDAAK